MAKAPQISFKTDPWRLLFTKIQAALEREGDKKYVFNYGIGKKHISMEEFQMHFAKTTSRGPDMSRVEMVGDSVLGFQRLAIVGLNESGMQPFSLHGNYVVCNGELYGFRQEKEILENEGYTFLSDSDCEIVLPMYEKYGVEMFERLDAEFAMISLRCKER